MQAIVAHKVLLKFERSICGLNINVGTWFRQFFQCVTDADHFSGIHKNLSWKPNVVARMTANPGVVPPTAV